MAFLHKNMDSRFNDTTERWLTRWNIDFNVYKNAVYIKDKIEVPYVVQIEFDENDENIKCKRRKYSKPTFVTSM